MWPIWKGDLSQRKRTSRKQDKRRVEITGERRRAERREGEEDDQTGVTMLPLPSRERAHTTDKRTLELYTAVTLVDSPSHGNITLNLVASQLPCTNVNFPIEVR